jgi:hypothetical protein
MHGQTRFKDVISDAEMCRILSIYEFQQQCNIKKLKSRLNTMIAFGYKSFIFLSPTHSTWWLI